MALRELAKDAGLSEELVRKMLWLINAHDQLISFVRICDNLSSILTLLEQRLGIALSDYGIEEWPVIADWVVSNRDNLVEEIGEDFDRRPRHSQDHPILGHGGQRHALYTALWSTHEDVEQQEEYQLLAGHLLLAHIRVTQERVSFDEYEAYDGPKEIPGYPNSPYGAALALRALSQSALPKFWQFDPNRQPEVFAHHLNRFAPTEDNELENRLAHYSRFIAKAFDKRRWVKRLDGVRRKRRSVHGARRWLPGYVDLYPDQEMVPIDLGDTLDSHEDWGQQIVVQEKIVDERRYLHLFEQDLHPAEFVGEDELYLSGYDCDDAKKGVAGLVFAAKGQVRHTIMEHQLLPWRNRQLTITELAALLTHCSHAFRELMRTPKWSEEEAIQAESIALLHVALWTGSYLERAKDLTILTKERRANCELGLFIPDEKEQSGPPIVEWRVRSHFPAYRKAIKPPKTIIRLRTQYVHLPDIAGGAHFVRHLRERKEYSKKNKPFARKLGVYRRAIQKVFAEIKTGERLNEHKIRSYLFHRIAVASGDVTQAVALTGQDHLLAEVRMFYSTPTVDSLRAIYVDAVTDVASYVYRAAGMTVPPPYASVPAVQNRHVGSRACATKEAVQQAVGKLKEAVESARTYGDQKQFAKYHNLYTLYTVLMFGYATACRAIITPFVPSAAIDSETDLTVLADKDGPDHHKSRLVWIPPEVRSQINHYESHCSRVLLNSRDALILGKRDTSIPACFFIDENRFSWKDVRPASLVPKLAEFLQLPANTHRRFMRTELRERGCPAEVVDAFMGHWYRGEEPWGKFSSFSVHDYITSLATHLVPLMQELGWIPIRSVLGSRM